MKETIKRVFRRPDTYKCLGIIVLAVLGAFFAAKYLSGGIVMLLQIGCYMLAMVGVFMFSKIVQSEQPADETPKRDSKKKKR